MTEHAVVIAGGGPTGLMLAGELDQNRATGTVVPAIFLAVAAFLLNVVLGRMIATPRTEIALRLGRDARDSVFGNFFSDVGGSAFVDALRWTMSVGGTPTTRPTRRSNRARPSSGSRAATSATAPRASPHTS